MVILTPSLFAKLRKITRKYQKSGFRDSLRVFVAGGSGGNGLPKFGGVGGKGGDVSVIANENLTLEDVFKRNKTKRYVAQNGRHSSHNFILGIAGEDLKFEIPTGVTIIDETGKKLGELNKDGEELLLARGGIGGHKKNGFKGLPGVSHNVHLDLKLIADIGLVGFPNAGKSTLLRAISQAKPRIASYPFTTIKPNLGIIEYKDLRQISMADLPGLIEGAYANKGMGHSFLKHVERTKLLLLVVDINGFQLSPQYPHRSCLETIMLLNKELELYNEDLLLKPSMILINKMDSENAQEKYNEIKDNIVNFRDFIKNYSDVDMKPKIPIKFCDIMPISAKESSSDILKVKQRLRNLLDVMADLENENEDNTYPDIKNALKEKTPVLV
ncbi:GTP-binding protein 10 homolog [Aethina tumida]|uniref:GTP-binding protein 10 homolog n=1 Tax=Aethina tumida TaxID=116153 RepID=UPI00096B3C5A|nr:GTP-binding protein 10 homolog [Aethina tumida]